jgi:hypothetical protein
MWIGAENLSEKLRGPTEIESEYNSDYAVAYRSDVQMLDRALSIPAENALSQRVLDPELTERLRWNT